MKLLIVESPAKAKTISKYLGKDFHILASYGHVRTIPSRKDAVRPDQDFQIDYEIITSHKSSDKKNSKKSNTSNIIDNKYINNILSKAKQSSTIYLAPDPDREGEAISWHISEILREHGISFDKVKLYRIEFNSITKSAIDIALQNPRAININLVHAQQARQSLDYLVGFNISPILWRKLPGSKSAGRVQSVALRIICEREAEIRDFKSKEYWTVNLECLKEKKKFSAHLTNYQGKKLGKHGINSQEEVVKIKEYLSHQRFQIASIDKKESKKNPNPPFTTSTMLQDAARKLGFNTDKTSKIAQKLYEGIDINGELTGLITYMRTDSVVISNEGLNEIRSVIQQEYGQDYLSTKVRIFKNKNKTAQEAHEAIRPTNPLLKPGDIAKYLNEDYLSLYDLIWRRSIASQMASAIFDTTTCIIEDQQKEQSLFRASGRIEKFDGFYVVYLDKEDSQEQENNQELPNLQKGEEIKYANIITNQHFTQPPSRYNEASLVKKMEELGIGRPSTYASIMSVIQQRDYVHLDKKRFFASERGELVNAFLINFFTQYVQYDFTANLESELDLIALGESKFLNVLNQFWQPFHAQVTKVSSLDSEIILKTIAKYLEKYIFQTDDRLCPSCQKGYLNLRNSKYGSFVACSSYPECQYKRNMYLQDDNIAESSTKIFPKEIGEIDIGTIFLNNGKFGLYLRVIKDDKQIKTASVPSGFEINDIDLSIAKDILSLPKKIGLFNNHEVSVGIGRYGPYILYNKKYYGVKLKENKDIIYMNIADAIVIIEQKMK